MSANQSGPVLRFWMVRDWKTVGKDGMFSAKFLVMTVGLVTFAFADLHFSAQAVGAEPTKDGWISLFNGKDLKGWDIWLGRRTRRDKKPIGLNKDPKHVFTVVKVDGRPAIRISGEIPGAITSGPDLSA